MLHWYFYVLLFKWANIRSHSQSKILLDTLPFYSLTVCVPGSSVAQLKATDPEGEPLIYGVSGEEAMRYFSVNKDTGVVWLRQQLDREVRTPDRHTHWLTAAHTLKHYQSKCTVYKNRHSGQFWKQKMECKLSNDEREVKSGIFFSTEGWKRKGCEFIVAFLCLMF